MIRSKIELPGGGYATESEILSALAKEARQRKTSYGLLVVSTTEKERAEIVRGYCAEQRKSKSKRKKG